MVIKTRVAAQGTDGLSRLPFCDGQIDVSRRDERVGARVRGDIHARDVGLALLPLGLPAFPTALMPAPSN
ncbi:MAG: hypothetical protein ABTR92_10340 [Candidatus Accumulibacter phosphatis]|uniref:hypothetical protein n=1 Tax=Candidatus Accumulibacter sp. ACC012 TaxID=2823332 RepID=UPI0025BA13C8|nr:hypothetical protein [Candidatus Accumulibacter sp. ACC012]